MIEKSINRLGTKILSKDSTYFSIKDDDRKAMSEIINYYNATNSLALESNELAVKQAMFILMKSIEKNRDKKLKEIIQLIAKEVAFCNFRVLKEFLSMEIDLTRWVKVCREVGVDIENPKENDVEKMATKRKELIEVVINPFNPDDCEKIVKSFLGEIIIRSEYYKNKV